MFISKQVKECEKKVTEGRNSKNRDQHRSSTAGEMDGKVRGSSRTQEETEQARRSSRCKSLRA